MVDSKQEWACWQHTSAKYRVCQQCLWVFLRQLVVGVWKNHPHVSVDEKHRRLEEFHCTVCSSLQLHREHWTYLCSVSTYLTELEDYDSTGSGHFQSQIPARVKQIWRDLYLHLH